MVSYLALGLAKALGLSVTTVAVSLSLLGFLAVFFGDDIPLTCPLLDIVEDPVFAIPEIYLA